MHELTVVRQIIAVSSEYAKKNEAAKVEEIYLHIGALNQIVEPMLFKAFDFAKKGTMCEEAAMSVTFSPLILRCDCCGEEFTTSAENLYTAHCPKCDEQRNKYVSGREFFIDYIKVS